MPFQREDAMPKLEDHPLSQIFPLMEDADLDSLGDDIETNGLRDPIWLLDGKILDGRNRYRACVKKDIDHRTEHYKGKDPLGFVLSKNLHRRHLTTSQRAMVAANIATWKLGDNQFKGGGSANLQTLSDAAAAVNVSTRSAADAAKVIANGTPALQAAVVSGAASVSAAATVADLPKKEQKAAVKSGTVAEKAKETKEKPRCELCKRKGLFRLDSCPECLDLQKAKKPEKYKPATFDDEAPITNPRTLPPTVVPINPDAEGVTSAAAGGGHPFLDLLADIRSLSARMTKTIKADGEDEHRLYTYLTYCGLLDHDPAKNGAAYFLPLRGVSKLVDMAGEGGKVKTKTQVENAYLIACGGKQAWIPPVTARRRAGKKS